MAHQAQIGLGSNDRHRRGHALRLQVSLNMAETHSWPVGRMKSCHLPRPELVLGDYSCSMRQLEQEAVAVREPTWDPKRPRKSTEAVAAVEVVEAPP